MSARGDLIHCLALRVYLESLMIHGSKGLDNGSLNRGSKGAPAVQQLEAWFKSLSLTTQQPLRVRRGQVPKLDNRQCAN